MPDQLVVIWRNDSGQLISTIADEGRHPRVFSAQDTEIQGLDILDDEDAETVIHEDSFERVAVSAQFARTVLGWTV